jgi:anti-anti-sigma regulatory factor
MAADSQVNLATSISRLREQAVAQLGKYVGERGQRERMRFMLAQDNHRIFVEEFLESYGSLTDKQVERDFTRLFARDRDGVIRNRQDRFNIHTDAGVYIGKDVEVTPDIKRRVVTARLLCQHLGPAWRTRFQNTYVTMPENIMVIFWPEVPWCQNAESELSIPNEEFGWVADVAHNPERTSVWTGLFYDHVAAVWMVSCETPIDIDGKHLATVGHDVTLDELLDRAVHDHLPGAYNVIFRPDGRLISHPRLIDDIKKQEGYFDIHKCNDEQLQSIFSQVIERKAEGVIEDRANRSFFAVTHIKEPDWYFVVVVPEETLLIDELTSEFESQARSLSEMSIPVTQLWEKVLLLPVVGFIDDSRAQAMMRAVLSNIAKIQAHVLILDISGVGELQERAANHLVDIAKAAQIMGCRPVISGVSPDVARTIVNIGANVDGITTTSNLARGLDVAFSRIGVEIH